MGKKALIFLLSHVRLAFNIRGAVVMKRSIHPDYHEINVIMTDGSAFKTKSTWGKDGDTLKLDIDSKSHPAWTGIRQLVDTGGQLAKFKNRYKDFGLKTS
jgi:large subunit ribosomal protein L31